MQITQSPHPCRHAVCLQALGDLLNQKQGRSAQPSQADEAPINPAATSRTAAGFKRGSGIGATSAVKAPAVSRRGSTVGGAAVEFDLNSEVPVTESCAYQADVNTN